MFRKKVWIPILIVCLVVMGCGLFYGRKAAKQKPVTITKPVEVEQPAGETSKPPPPGETAESGHWHGDVWHAEPHEAPAEPSSTAEVNQPTLQEIPSVIPQGDSTANPNQESSEASTRTRTPQEVAKIQRQWREWQAWTKKAQELRVKFGQVSQLNTDLMPKTAEEAERYQTDKEWQRKVQEATDKYDEVLGALKEHEANKVLPPSQPFRQ